MRPRSELANEIVRYLAMHDKGQMISYEELSQHVSAAISAATSQLGTSFNVLAREYGQVWRRVPPKLGVRRLHDSEIVARNRNFHLVGARRKLNRGDGIGRLVNPDELSLDDKARWAANAFIFAAGLNTLSARRAREQDKIFRGTSNDLPTFNAVEWATRLTKK